MTSKISYKDWHLPISNHQITLKDAFANLKELGGDQAAIPLIVQLVENPKFDLPGVEIFNGATDLNDHDCIHLLLGRGLLPMDEAFVIGFTMGSTNRVTTTEENLYSFFAKHLFPKVYRMDDDDLHVFKDAVKLGFISDCQPLNKVNYDELLPLSLADARKAIGLEESLIKAYYEIEQKRYPNSKASQRLLV